MKNSSYSGTEWFREFSDQFHQQQALTEALADVMLAYETLRKRGLKNGEANCYQELESASSHNDLLTLAQKNKQIESQQALLNDLQFQLSSKEVQVRDLSTRLATSMAQSSQIQAQLESTHKQLEQKELEVISLKNEIKGMENADKIEILESINKHPPIVISPTPGLSSMVPKQVSLSHKIGKTPSLPPTVITASRGGLGPQLVAVGSRKLHCFNANSGGTVCEIDVISSTYPSACILSLAVAFENDSVLLGTSESQLSLVDLNGRLLKDLKGHSGKVKGCGFLANKSKAFSVSTDRTLKLWDLTRASPIRSVPVTSQLVGGVATLDGTMLVTCHLNGKLIVWSQTERICEIDAHADACLGLALSPDGRFITSVGKDDVCAVVDIHMAQSGPIHMLRGFRGLPTDGPPAVSLDSKIVSVCAHSGIHSWDLLLGSPLGDVPTDAAYLTWAPGCIGGQGVSEQVVTAHESGVIKWWSP